MKLTKELLFREAEDAGIAAEQTQELWDRLSSATADQQPFDALQVAYYFGGMIVIGAMRLRPNPISELEPPLESLAVRRIP